jgi:hypothetical protein
MRQNPQPSPATQKNPFKAGYVKTARKDKERTLCTQWKISVRTNLCVCIFWLLQYQLQVWKQISAADQKWWHNKMLAILPHQTVQQYRFTVWLYSGWVQIPQSHFESYRYVESMSGWMWLDAGRRAVVIIYKTTTPKLYGVVIIWNLHHTQTLRIAQARGLTDRPNPADQGTPRTDSGRISTPTRYITTSTVDVQVLVWDVKHLRWQKAVLWDDSQNKAENNSSTFRSSADIRDCRNWFMWVPVVMKKV